MLILRNFSKKSKFPGRHRGNKISILPGLLPQHLWRKSEKIFFQNFDSQSRIFWLIKKFENIFSIFWKLHFWIFHLEFSMNGNRTLFKIDADWSVRSANQNSAFGDLFVSTEFCQPRHFRCHHQANEVKRVTRDVKAKVWWQLLYNLGDNK